LVYAPTERSHQDWHLARHPAAHPGGLSHLPQAPPGPWFNSTSSPQEYERLYRAEVLAPLDPRQVAAELDELVRGMIPVIVCFERVNNPKGD
jgi:hypothetical protein